MLTIKRTLAEVFKGKQLNGQSRYNRQEQTAHKNIQEGSFKRVLTITTDIFCNQLPVASVEERKQQIHCSNTRLHSGTWAVLVLLHSHKSLEAGSLLTNFLKSDH